MDYAPFKIPSRMAGDFSCHYAIPPFPQKVTLHLRCSLASALTTLRLATNFLRVRLRRMASFYTRQTHLRWASRAPQVFLFLARSLCQSRICFLNSPKASSAGGGFGGGEAQMDPNRDGLMPGDGTLMLHGIRLVWLEPLYGPLSPFIPSS